MTRYIVTVFARGLPAIILLCAGSVVTTAQGQDFNYKITTSQAWTDTGLDLHPGDVLLLSATGTNGDPGCNPDGSAGASAVATKLPLVTALPGALIARLEENGSPLLVGSHGELRATESGHLYFGINAGDTPPCQGSFAVKVHLTPGQGTPSATAAAGPTESLAANSATASPSTPAPGGQPSSAAAGSGQEVKDVKGALMTAAQTWLSGQLGTGSSSQPTAATSSAATAGTAAATPALKASSAPLDAQLRKDIDGLPRRVNDQLQNLGDMVNFVIVGSQKKMQDALTAADWHVADRDVKESVMKAVLETYEKKAYVQMPMSDLYLFGRVQDFGYEQAEPYAVVASRHHFRIWKAPFQWDSQEVWVGAGTHDIGFEKDQRTGGVTHKIDPAVDGERDHIGSTLEQAKLVKTLTYYLPAHPVQESKNATGGGYHSDGRILVMVLN
jgi:hypothetical protein